MNAIPESQAVVCLDCGSVSDGKSLCSACGSRAVYALHFLLNRKQEMPPYPVIEWPKVKPCVHQSS